MARDDLHMRIRLPREVKEWISEQAERNVRSQTAEIVFILKTAMARADQPTTTT